MSTSHDTHELGHGHSVALWTAVGILMVGFAVMSWSAVVLSWPLFIAGWVIVLIGVIAGYVLNLMGFGSTTIRHGESTDVLQDAPDSDRPVAGIN
ncbi:MULTISPECIES: HGxxPAAW family protein [unclassified Janibacter]|uniref:HGxxPAAW family protein n=1 Tax=unclassified Janibacter TaxID=2649294 RepID=UPI003D0009D6